MSGQQADNTLYENSLGWGIMVLVLGVITWIIWYYRAEEIRDFVRWLRYSEMWLLSFFLSDDYEVFHNGQMVSWQRGFEDTADFSKPKLSFAHLSYFNSLALQPLKVIFVGLASAGGLWCMFWGPNTQFRQELGLEGLVQRQSKVFPVISPFTKFNPSTQPPRPPGTPVPAELPLFGEALGPEEWVAYYKIPIPDGKMDEKALKKAFQTQLKGRWKGANALPPYMQILLASFCLKASRKRDPADEMLGRLANCWDFKGGLKLSRDKSLLKDARKILRNKELSGKTLAQANRHAFITTAMLRSLAFAREEGGVLAPAQFVWLRAHDRTLWYPMNNMGRQSFHMESMGAMSHYRAEKMTQRPIPIPKLEDAVDSIIEYMGSMLARPIPQLDYSGSKKRGVKKAE